MANDFPDPQGIAPEDKEAGQTEDIAPEAVIDMEIAAARKAIHKTNGTACLKLAKPLKSCDVRNQTT